MATGSALTAFPERAYPDPGRDAVGDAHVVVTATAWPEFARVDPAAAGTAPGPRTVVDACQGINTAVWRAAGWRVLSLTGDNADHWADQQTFRAPVQNCTEADSTLMPSHLTL